MTGLLVAEQVEGSVDGGESVARKKGSMQADGSWAQCPAPWGERDSSWFKKQGGRQDLKLVKDSESKKKGVSTLKQVEKNSLMIINKMKRINADGQK